MCVAVPLTKEITELVEAHTYEFDSGETFSPEKEKFEYLSATLHRNGRWSIQIKQNGKAFTLSIVPNEEGVEGYIQYSGEAQNK